MLTRLVLAAAVLAACGDDPSDSMMDAAPPETDGAVPALDAALLDGGAAPDAFAGADLGPSGTYFGRVLYEDRPQDELGFTGAVELRAAPGFRVALLDGSERIVEETRTDAEGRFAFTAASGGVTVRAWADASFADHQVVVTDRRRAASVYALDALAVEAGETMLLATAAELGGPFNVAAVSWGAFALYAPFVGAAAPTLSFRWEAGRAFACGSCYGGDEISLGGGLDDTDEYDDVIILHELGHYFVEHYSADSSSGGTHRDMQVEPTLAYGEGLGYAFACVVNESPWIIDTFAAAVRGIDLEAVTLNGVAEPTFEGTTDGTATGDLREEIVAGILWDAFDEASPAEPFDRVALGIDGLMTLLVDHFGAAGIPDDGARGIDLTDFLNALVCVSGIPAADVAELAADRAFPWSAPSC